MVSLNSCSSRILIFPGIILKINILSPPHPQGELITYGDLCPSSSGAARVRVDIFYISVIICKCYNLITTIPSLLISDTHLEPTDMAVCG